MMKKLSKIALLAAASAFMLAVFPACGDDAEDKDPPKATLALVGDEVVLKAGIPTTVEATVTVENDTFSTEAKAIPAGKEIPKGYFELKATDAKVTVSEATLKEWTSDAVAKISFTATAAEDAEAGTISAEIKEGTLTSNVSLTAEGSIDYTVKSADKVDGTGGNEGDGNQNQNQGENGNQNQSGNEGGEQGGNKNPDKNATATFTFLSGEYTNSSTAVAAEGFFDGAKDGSLAVTVSTVELQLYKTEGGWTAIDASASSTKAAGGANMGGAGGPASVQAQLTTKNDAVANQSNEVFGENGYEMGRIKLVVTTSESAVVLKKISGYFGSGKSFGKGFVKVDGNKYKEITGTTALGTKGFSVEGFEVNQTIPANSEKNVYILLGKVATSAPSAGGTIDVAKLVYEFAAAEN